MFTIFAEETKRPRNGELAPLKSPRKKEDRSGNIYREKRPSRPLSPKQQVDIMLSIEQEEAKVIGDPSPIDMEVSYSMIQQPQSLNR